MILMPKLFNHILLITILPVVVSCQSNRNKANEVLNNAIQMEKAQNEKPEQDSGKLSIQNSTDTGLVKKAPSQEELIKKHKVKSVKETYSSGWLLSTYDKNGSLISTESDYGGKKTFSYEFDKKGQVVKEKTRLSDGSTITRKFTYNEAGKLISKTFATSDDKKVSVTSFEYNTRLNTRTESSSTGTDKEFYDNRGLRVRFESYDENGKLVGSGEATYDENGLKASESSTVMGMKVNDVFEYNENAQLLNQHRTGMLDVYFVFEYNEKGLISRSKNIKGYNEDLTVYEYRYY